MKKLILLAAAAWLCLGAGIARADMASAPGAMPGRGQFQAGLQGSWLFVQEYKNQDVKVSRGAASYSAAVKDAKITDDKSLMAGIAYGLSDRISVFAKLGVFNGGRFKFSSWDADSGAWWSNKFKLKSVFTWALGAKFRAFESPRGVGILLAVQYQRYDGRKAGDMESLEGGISHNDFQADFWQADLALSFYKKLGRLTPYAGLGYEHAELSIAGRANLGTPYANHIDFGDLENKDSLNAFVGLGWRATNNLSLTVQGNFIAHDALTLGLSWAF